MLGFRGAGPTAITEQRKRKRILCNRIGKEQPNGEGVEEFVHERL